jgi:uroporphyrinogen decarboxylase
MNNRELVTASLNHRQPDKIPYSISFTWGARKKMVEYYGDEDFEQKLGNSILGLNTEPEGMWKEVSPDVREDQFGVQWNRSVDKDIGVVCNRVISPENIDDYPFPDPDEPSRYRKFEKAVKEKPEQFILADLGFSLFERAWTMTGMENFLMAMIDDKPFANRLLDRILEFNLRIIENACSNPIQGMMFGDDWGQQRGLIMGPELWREFIRPRVRQMYQAVKAKGKFVFIHSCGKVNELFPDLIECGLDVFNPFQPEVMDVFEMKKIYGDRLSFFGGISTQKTLPYGTVAQVKDEVRKLLEVVGKNGGYIAAPAHSIPRDAKSENIAAMIEVLRGQ